MSVTGLFNRLGVEFRAGEAPAPPISRDEPLSNTEKLAILDDLEQSGLSWFWASDLDGKIAYVSDALADCMGREADDLVGLPITKIFQTNDENGQSQSLALKLGARKPFNGLTVSIGNPKASVVISLSGRPFSDEEDGFAGYRGMATDISEQYHREQANEKLAKFDSLTGLSNRHQMTQSLENTLTAFRAAKRNCAVMLLDLDRFKQVNDTLGHAAGDELLKQVALRLKRAAGDGAVLARIGGDEFQIVLQDMDDRGDLAKIAKRIIAMISQPYSLEDGRCVIGCSIGVAIAPYDGITGDELQRASDMALYAAKNGGRGQFRFYSAELANEALFRRRLEEDLAEAANRDELSLRYQPIVSLDTQQVVSLESQLVWRHAQFEVIDEEELRSILASSSLTIDIGKWAIRQACLDARDWPEPLRVAVNVPSAQFGADGFVDDVAAALKESGIAPERLELQMTESVFLGDDMAAEKVLKALFKIGVRLSLDEFGIGYSSLSYLRRAPFDSIRVTSGFYNRDIETEEFDTELITALVALARALGMSVKANGVETMALHKSLAASGVKFAQGSLYIESMPIEQVQEELASGNWKIEPVISRNHRARRRTVYRKIQVIHDDHSYDVTLRNLSRSGALIEGLCDVPLDTQFVVDLGGGQLAVAAVVRSADEVQGLEFERPLVEDGTGGLCTPSRVSPYALAAAGAPLEALSGADYKAMQGGLAPGHAAPKFGYAGE